MLDLSEVCAQPDLCPLERLARSREVQGSEQMKSREGDQKKGVTNPSQISFTFSQSHTVTQVFEDMNHRPDVIRDQRLPLMNGVEATKEMMRIDPLAKVFFVSAGV